MKDDILAGIDDVLLEASSSTIKHKVWNSLFDGWEDLDEYNNGSDTDLWAPPADRVGGWQWLGGCDCDVIYGTTYVPAAHLNECFPAKETLKVDFYPLFGYGLTYTNNFAALLWQELYLGPCYARFGYESGYRVLDDFTYRKLIWSNPQLPQMFTPEEQDKIIEILLSFDNPTPIGE